MEGRGIWHFTVRGFVFLLLAMVAVIAIYPISYMGLSSFKTSVEYIKYPVGLPASFHYLDNYRAMFIRFNIPRLFMNTMICIAGATVLSLLPALPASYAFAKIDFPFRQTLRTIMIATLIVPAITFIVPSYVMFSRWGLINSYWSIILLWGATAIPGNIFLLSSLMRGIPNDIIEAGRLDGAGYFENLRRIVVPLSVPGLVTVTIFNVTTWWNDLLIPLIFIQSDDKMTVTVGVATVLGKHSSDYPLLLTGLFISSIPPIVVYVLLQRVIRRGLVIGAVK